MNIFGDRIADRGRRIGFNTGTPFDLMSGEYEVGADGRWYCTGGMGFHVTSVQGGGNTYKSSLGDGFMMCCIANYAGTYGFDADTEGSKNGDRVRSMINSPLQGIGSDSPSCADAGERYTLDSSLDLYQEVIEKDIKDLATKRMANKKKITIKTPFKLNGSIYETWLPSYYFIDSWSEMQSEAVIAKMEKEGVSDKSSNNSSMENGRVKSLFLPRIVEKCQTHGFCFMITIRTDDVGPQMGQPSHLPPPKDLTHQKTGKKAKDAGSKAKTMIHCAVEVWSSKALMTDDRKACRYPRGDTPMEDLQVLDCTTIRNKLTSSGVHVPMVVSQKHGLLPGATHFHFLAELLKTKPGKKQTRFMDNGLIGAGPGKYRLAFYPDVVFTRKDMREHAETDYKFARALQLMFRMAYIRESWNISGYPVDMTMKMEDVYEMAKKKGIDMDMVLETTSIWAPGLQTDKDGHAIGAHGRRHMTIIEFLDIVQNS